MYEANFTNSNPQQPKKRFLSIDKEKGYNFCCRAAIALLGYFNVIWFCFWLLEIRLYDDVTVTGRCGEIPDTSNAYVTCGALYCANRIADLITGVVLILGVHMRNPAFLQAFVLYEMFTFISWNIIFLLYWNYANLEADLIEYTMKFLVKRALQLFFMYVVMAYQKDMQLENEEKRKNAIRFYI